MTDITKLDWATAKEVMEERISNNWTTGSDCRYLLDCISELETENARFREALKDVRALIACTASVILMPGRKNLNNAGVSIRVITDAQQSMKVIELALAETEPKA